ncbi:ribosome silencing factor [Paenibacillus yanchengensis]|uniref:Ribosomal silencing factor RsfS n=1 Tax=Paenibacillus yanchengensis TaxID=2035833 RepID=A0ABW4YKM0_9BACL
MNLQIDTLMAAVVHAAEDKKGHNVVALDLKGLSLVADYFVICSGNSDAQVQAIATEIKKVAEQKGAVIRGMEGMNSARWVLIDMGDVIAHVFHREEREFYSLEKLWSDAREVEFT